MAVVTFNAAMHWKESTMSISLRKNPSTPRVHQDSFGRFQVITERGASWSPDPPTVREVHEARARELQREAVTLAAHRVSAWLRRAMRSFFPVQTGPVPPSLFTIQRRL
jgi:hypothetical protein